MHRGQQISEEQSELRRTWAKSDAAERVPDRRPNPSTLCHSHRCHRHGCQPCLVHAAAARSDLRKKAGHDPPTALACYRQAARTQGLLLCHRGAKAASTFHSNPVYTCRTRLSPPGVGPVTFPNTSFFYVCQIFFAVNFQLNLCTPILPYT